MIKRPLFLVAIAFAAGIGLSGVLGLPVWLGMSALGFGCVFAVARRAFSLALLFAIAGAGMLHYVAFTTPAFDDVSHFLRSSATAVVGRVSSDMDVRSDRAYLPIDVSAVQVNGRLVRASGRLMVTCYRPTDEPNWRPPDYGDLLLVKSRLSRPGGPSNPGAFSYRDYLARQRIYAVTYVRGPGQIEKLPGNDANPIITLALRTKEGLSDSIASVLPSDEAAVVTGMDLGTYTTLPDRLFTNFQRTGTLHLLAASGFNCAVLVAIFGLLFARLTLPKKLVSPALIAILIFYMLMVGAKPSIVRATIMACVFLLGPVLNRPSDSLNALFAAAMLILAISPTDLFDVGFQLSFAAVLSLLIMMPLAQNSLKRWWVEPMPAKKVWGWPPRASTLVLRDTWQGLFATIAATLGTIPLSAHYFNQFSLVSVIVNAAVAATVLPIAVVGMLAPIVSHIPILSSILSIVGTGITRFALSTINWFGELPFSSLSVASPGVAGIVGYYVILAVVTKYAYSRIIPESRA